jgi:hypothetical protein
MKPVLQGPWEAPEERLAYPNPMYKCKGRGKDRGWAGPPAVQERVGNPEWGVEVLVLGTPGRELAGVPPAVPKVTPP